VLDWNDLRTFAEVARRGSLSAAARALGVHQTTVARRLAAAEDALGAPLFLRSTRGLALAPAGTRLAASLGPLVDVVDDVARQAADRTRHPVRVAATDNGARILAARIVARLAGEDPPVELELITGNAVVDLARNEADLAVRVIAPAEPSLVRQRLGENRYALYASREYLGGAPPWRDEGAGHRILVPSAELASGPEARWLAEHARAARVACRASSHTTLAVASEHGAGLCVMPTNLAAFHPRLVVVRRLPEIPERPVWLVIHRDARKEPRIRRVAELVATAMRAALRS
jgi:DNA-binding transcriptional LysR family regulator